MDPTGLQAITFDCYDTLIDREAGIAAYVTPILAASKRAGAVDAAGWLQCWRSLEAAMTAAPWRPYREILQASYEATMSALEVEIFHDGGPGLVASVANWEAFPEVAGALRRLGRHRWLGLVADTDRDLLGPSVGRLQAPFSSLLTAEDAGAYKPDSRPLELALERLSLPAAQVLHVSAHPGELAMAQALGMPTARLRREPGPHGGANDATLVVEDLNQLADALG